MKNKYSQNVWIGQFSTFNKLYRLILMLVFLIPMKMSGQDDMYGMTRAGGSDDLGTIFKVDGEGNNQALTSFNTNYPGGLPFENLTQADNGKLYGMTYVGGTSDQGVIFEYDPVTGMYSKKFDFNNTNGARPQGSLTRADNGIFYGMTYHGGAFSRGVLFEYDPTAGTYTKKIDFNGINGQNPYGSLTLADSGKLYGMTVSGGTYGQGVLFEYDPTAGTYTKKIDFNGSNGARPQGSLTQAPNGKLYGMTYVGGTYGQGVLFEYDPSTGNYTKKIDFNGTNGARPQGSLTQAANGKLYGMTANGGVFDRGVLFEYDPTAGTDTKKIDFDLTNGANPYGSLTQAANGKLYGMTVNGGVFGRGVLFEYVPTTETYTKKFDFDLTNGANPFGSLTQTVNGKLYGMTRNGGASFRGVLFEYDPTTGNYTKKLDFNYAPKGANPNGGLTHADNGNLYGMTLNGGVFGRGVLFEYDPVTGTYTKKHDFDLTNGANPYGSLIQASNGKLYGMTSNGGTYFRGVLFEYDPSTGSYTKKIDFNGTNGQNPYGSLIQAVNGKLYGMTSSGGASVRGVLFEYDPTAGTYTKKLDFNGTNGQNPYGSPTQAANGKLYGMTFLGGTSNRGVLFEYDPATGSYIKKIDFNGASNGDIPRGGLTPATNGKLYGMTVGGGSAGRGVLFEYDPIAGTYTKKLDFDGINGQNPYGSLTQAANGKLYGMTLSGGTTYGGVLFEYDLSTGGYIKKIDFNGANGQNPYGSLVQINSGCIAGAPTPDISQLKDLEDQCSVEEPEAPTATNNCGETLIGTTETVFPISEQGETTIIWTFDDGNGNVSTQSQKVIITDTEKPKFDAASLPTDQLGVDMDAKACGATITFADPTATDNCDPTVTVVRTDNTNLNSGDLFPEGETIISYKVTDAASNESTYSFKVSVNPDAEKPEFVVASLPTDQLGVDMDAKACGAAITFADPTATDNCDPTVTVVRTDNTNLNSGDLFPEGETIISYKVTDAASNESTYSFKVSVNPDAEKPEFVVASLPTDQLGVDMDAKACGATITFADPTATDNCDPSLTVVRSDNTGLNSGDLFPEGETIISYKVTDTASNESTYSFKVSVNPDAEKPEFVVASLPTDQLGVDMDAKACGATITFADPTATDNCDPTVTVVRTDNTNLNSGDLFPEGETIISYKVTDAASNESTYSFKVSVNPDAEKPEFVVASLPTDQLGVDMDAGACGATITFADPTATDNCDPTVTVVRTDNTNLNSGDLFPEGETIISYKVTDAASNESTYSFKVSVNPDAEKPEFVVASLPTDQLGVDMDAKACGAAITFADPTATDNCDPTVTVVRTDNTNLNSGDLFPEGETIISYKVTDAASNESTYSFKVSVNPDAEKPEFVVASLPTDQLGVDMDAGACGATITFADPTATDNCDPTVTVVRTDNTNLNSGDLFPEGETIISYKVTDAASNESTYSFKVSVNPDKEKPVISCAGAVTVATDKGFCTASNVNLGTPQFSDNCSDVTVSNDAPTVFPYGITDVTWTATDQAGNKSTCIQKVIVNKVMTITSIDVNITSQQYSDKVTFTANIKQGECSIAGQAAQTVSFFAGTQNLGTVNLTKSGEKLIGTLTAPLLESPSQPSNGQMAPGVHVVEARFGGVNSNFTVSNPKTSINILREDAIVEYTGQTLQATESSKSGLATIQLSANIQDITATNTLIDPDAGDIRNAKVKFVNRDTNSDISGWIQVQDLLNSSDSKTGAISFNWNVDIGSQESESFTLGILVDSGYYYRNSSDDNVLITVYKPVGDFITGGGFIIPLNASGSYVTGIGLKTNFGFNVKYNKKGTKLRGHMNVIFRSQENDGLHTYQIKGNAIQSLGVNIADNEMKTAEFITKSNLKDITDPLNPIDLGGNLTLKVVMTDRGEPGMDDSIAIELTNKRNKLLYSSSWTGINTAQTTIGGGNVLVHSGFSLGYGETVVKATVNKEIIKDIFKVNSWPNPSDNYFNIEFKTSNFEDMINIYVFDLAGRMILKKQSLPNAKLELGSSFTSGIYLVKVIQGDKNEQLRLIRK
ncbi:choice-of-anchor tandem repeat GloVer-containing protein [Lutimonas zeaxanthinifaciens]|uniref:choice-of-anchor tandem repeat GloVer-containing protein n=1 Tax=Lutimonas zeaxanthinifaciens TaxID=3060215 RepID=UPI00265CE7B0|nr:choice-of-anchor tandem repeat GloVer-containing protein [Lutimonas sp. YSD2104]WKK66356.1 HYR domain-containing protein [Lutimonas sp. YSD2104]